MFFNKKKKDDEQEVLELPRTNIQEETHEEEFKPIDVTNGSLQTVDESLVWDALKECYDPEIPVNIVDLGLVYGLQIQENFAYVKMTLTAPGCGMGPMIASDVRRKVLQVPGVRDAKIDLVFTPPWEMKMMSEQAKLILNIP
jgi:metal-sulfur cluster biosynthetic enzyme